MALFEDTLLEGLAPGVAIGLGALVMAPAVLSLVGSVARPLVKAAIKGGLVLYGQGRAIVAETRETIGDLVAESQSELSGRAGAAPAASGARGTMETEGGAV